MPPVSGPPPGSSPGRSTGSARGAGTAARSWGGSSTPGRGAAGSGAMGTGAMGAGAGGIDPEASVRTADAVAAGVPEQAAQVLVRVGCPPGTLSRLLVAGAAHSRVWALLVSSDRSPEAVQGPSDLLGLMGLVLDEVDDREIARWARLGALATAFALHGRGYRPEQVEIFAEQARGRGGLVAVNQMILKATRVGMIEEDVPKWFLAGVAFTRRPFVDGRAWTAWRQVAVHVTGMPTAALAAAAGLSPDETRTMHAAGQISRESLELMHQLRAFSTGAP